MGEARRGARRRRALGGEPPRHHPHRSRGRGHRGRRARGARARAGLAAWPSLVQLGARSQQEQGVPDAGWYGVLQSAGLLFFAFAGYARIATLGEEVRDPARTIPRAIAIALGVVVAVYGAVAVVLLLVLGPAYLAAGVDAPLADLVAVSGWAWAVPVVQVGAGLAALGALLALIAGIGRTTLAMARDRRAAGAARRGASAVRGAARRRDRGGRGDRRARARGRPAGRDRVQLLRRARVLPRRERVGVHPAASRASRAAVAERRRRDRMPRAGRDPAGRGGARGSRRVRRRGRVPVGATSRSRGDGRPAES